MPRVRQVNTDSRRRDILNAALALFLERGVSQTTVDAVRARSGASVGSFYHHFAGGKDDIAAVLYLETIAEYQAGFLAEPRKHRQAARGITATVLYHLRWVESHRDAAHFLFNYGDLELRSRTDDALARLNARQGSSYSLNRRPDPSIAAQIRRALGGARRIVNAGAGTGSYEPTGIEVLAVEPSLTMIAQRPPGSAPAVCGRAEELPFGDGAFDVAMAVLTLHHWQDKAKGLSELRRVAKRTLVLTFDPSIEHSFWLVRDYLPEIGKLDWGPMPGPEQVAEATGARCIQVVRSATT